MTEDLNLFGETPAEESVAFDARAVSEHIAAHASVEARARKIVESRDEDLAGQQTGVFTDVAVPERPLSPQEALAKARQDTRAARKKFTGQEVAEPTFEDQVIDLRRQSIKKGRP